MMQLTHTTLARRYAQAVLRVYGDTLSCEVVKVLPKLAQIMRAHPSVLVYAGLSQKRVESCDTLVALCVEGGCDQHVMQSLCRMLAQKNRLSLLPLILESVYEGYLEQHNMMHFTIESATELSEQLRDQLVAYLKEKTQKEILYTLVHRPALIAGLRAYSATYGFEYSIKQQLALLHSAVLTA